MNSVQRAANNMTGPNQTFNGARQRIQPAPQIGSKKRLHTEDDELSRKRNATKHSRLLDMIQNPTAFISEPTQAHTVPTTTPSTAIAEDDEIAEAEITSPSALGNAATYQLISELTQAHTVPATIPSTAIAENDEIAEAETTTHSALWNTAIFQVSTPATHQDSTAGNPVSQTITSRRWSKEEETLLIQKTANQGCIKWTEISQLFPKRTLEACRFHACHLLGDRLERE